MSGMIFPHTAIPITKNKIWAGPHIATDGNPYDMGLQVMASLDADAVAELVFSMPPSLPTGTAKLLLIGLSAAIANSAKVNPKWCSVADGESNQATARQAEGVSTITWAAGDTDKYKYTKVTLDADVIVANEQVCMSLTFETAGWTLASISTWIACIIWE